MKYTLILYYQQETQIHTGLSKSQLDKACLNSDGLARIYSFVQ